MNRIPRVVTMPPQAAQMAELYWMALTRDVPFSQYGVDDATVEAAGNTHMFAEWSCRLWQGATSAYVETTPRG